MHGLGLAPPGVRAVRPGMRLSREFRASIATRNRGIIPCWFKMRNKSIILQITPSLSLTCLWQQLGKDYGENPHIDTKPHQRPG